MSKPAEISEAKVRVALDYVALCAEMTEPFSHPAGAVVIPLPEQMELVRVAALDVLEQHFLDAVRNRRIAEAAP